MFKPSHRQQAIFDVWESSESNILVNSVAGSGKTTLLLSLMERYCQESDTLFLAFNKSIQLEIEEKIHNKGMLKSKSMTMHSLGLKSLYTHYDRVFVKSGNSKNYDLVRQVQKSFPGTFRYMTWKDKFKLSKTLMDLNDCSRLFYTDDLQKLLGFMHEMNNPVADHNLHFLWEEMKKLRDESYTKKSVEVDFIDMIYLPIKKDLRIPANPKFLFLDEVQDFNLCQHLLIDKLLKQGSVQRWVAVGDSNQSIYGFSGAWGHSFDLFRTKSPNVKEMPLDICYRCASDIVDCANEVYDVMTSYKKYPGAVYSTQNIEDIKPNSLVICRNSGPLVDLYFQLISKGKSCHIKGEDVLSGLTSFLKPYKKLTGLIALYEIEKDLFELRKKNRVKEGIDFEEYQLKQNLESFRSIVEAMRLHRLKVIDILEEIKKLYTRKPDSIELSTIHKSKGMENSCVYILNEHLIPSPFAKTPMQQKQEENLRYVARTRAEDEMYFLTI
jgi:DNA helicase-2/ATP-dependent DNA helicase PcrA